MLAQPEPAPGDQRRLVRDVDELDVRLEVGSHHHAIPAAEAQGNPVGHDSGRTRASHGSAGPQTADPTVDYTSEEIEAVSHLSGTAYTHRAAEATASPTSTCERKLGNGSPQSDHRRIPQRGPTAA